MNNNDIIIIDINENSNKYSNTLNIFDIINNQKIPDIFVICTQQTDSSKNNFQKLFKTAVLAKNYILLKEYDTRGLIRRNISIQINIYIKNDIDRNNIKNIKQDSIYIDSDNSIQYLYFEYYFHKIRLFNTNINNDEQKKKINNFKIKCYPTQSTDNLYTLGGKNNIKSNNNTNSYNNRNSFIGGDNPYKQNLIDLIGYYIIFPHNESKIDSLVIININEEGNCFEEGDLFNKFYFNNIKLNTTDLIIVCSQNSISRKHDCKTFQTVLRDKIEKNTNSAYKFKNKKNSSGFINISRHISIGKFSSLGIRTRVYINKFLTQKKFDESLLNITFKSIDFTGEYGSILCSIEYNGQKIHVINSCFFDKKTLKIAGLFNKSYKNEKIEEYMKIIKEFELVKKYNDNLFFVGHNIKYNLGYPFVNSNNIDYNYINQNTTIRNNLNNKISTYSSTLSKNNESKILKIKSFIKTRETYTGSTAIQKNNKSINTFNTVNKTKTIKLPLQILKIDSLL